MYVWTGAERGAFHDVRNWTIRGQLMPPKWPPSKEDDVMITGLGGVWRQVHLEDHAVVHGIHLPSGRTWLSLRGRTLGVVDGRLSVADPKKGETRLVLEGGILRTGGNESDTRVVFGDAVGSEAGVTIKGKETRWIHAGESDGAAWVVGNRGRAMMRIEAAAQVEVTGAAPFWVGASLDGRGVVEIDGYGTRLTTQTLVLGGDRENNGGYATVSVTQEGMLCVDRALEIRPRGVLLLDGGVVQLAAKAKTLLRGVIGGAGVIRILPEKGVLPDPLVVEGVFRSALSPGSLVVEGGDMTLSEGSRLVVKMSENRARWRTPIVLDSPTSVARIEGARIEMTLAPKGRYATNDGFEIITAANIEMIQEPQIRLLGEGAERFSTKVVISKEVTGKYRGRQSLRVVLAVKQ